MRMGIVGLGAMGHACAKRLMQQGFAVNLFNRTANAAADLVADGAILHAQMPSLLQAVDVVLLLLSDADAIDAVVPVNELSDKIVVQMATISPAESRALAERVAGAGGDYLEAPVLGSIPEALSGKLIVMAGGEERVFDKVAPLLAELGHAPRRVGAVGTAAALKLAMNQLIAALTSGFALSLGYASENGVDVDVFMDTLRQSALYAPTYDKKLDKYLKREFGRANFSTRHLLKDVRLFSAHAQSLGLDTQALRGIERIVAQAVDQGLAQQDYSSIYQVINPPHDAD